MNKIAFHTEDELKRYKLSNYDSYTYTKYLECPECGIGSEIVYDTRKKQSILVGWCDTPQGFMMISECSDCGTRYRFHGTTTERFDYYRFLENFSLRLYMQDNK